MVFVLFIRKMVKYQDFDLYKAEGYLYGVEKCLISIRKEMRKTAEGRENFQALCELSFAIGHIICYLQKRDERYDDVSSTLWVVLQGINKLQNG